MDTKVLQQIEDAINGVVRPDHRDSVDETVMRAKRILYDASTHKKIFGDISKMTVDSDPQKLALGVAGLLTMMRKEDQHQGKGFPDQASVPISALILIDVIKFVTESGMVEEATPEMVGNCFEELFSIMLQKLNVGPQQIQEVNAQAAAIDPADPSRVQAPVPSPEQVPPGVIQGAVA